MTRFVLDNSVVMRWFTPSSNHSDRHYADRVLESMNESEAVVPGLFYLELIYITRQKEKRVRNE